MQLHALNEKRELVVARNAESKKNYTCLECEHIVRTRKGHFRKAHFYHINPVTKCSQQGKSLTHLAVQEYLYELLPPGEVVLEKRFPSINRIADVAWIERKIVFEIQCSPIDADEIIARNKDYQSIGFEPIWILHDKRYNKWRHCLAEKVLTSKPHYFTNMNQHGKGFIYDQFEVIQNGLRKVRLEPLPVNLSMPFSVSLSHSVALQEARRRLSWKWAFEGDLVSLCLQDFKTNYLKRAELEEQKMCEKGDLLNYLKKACLFLKELYLEWLESRLERYAINHDL